MRLIQDPSGLWIGKPPLMARKAAGDRPPVAIGDLRAVDPDGPVVRLPVTRNDIDPEGGAMTLVSAFAALGTATVDAGVVRYVPPAGLTGTDTIVYEIADTLGQTDTGEVTVTLAPIALALETTADNRIEITAADAALSLTVTQPAALSGTLEFDAALLSDGPVCLVPPSFTGDAGTPGATLSAVAGLWAHDAGDPPTRGWRWRRDGVDIPGATGATRLVDAADPGATLSVVETMTGILGTREMDSSGFVSPADDAGLLHWWDAGDAASLTESGGAVSAWSDATGGVVLTMAYGPDKPTTGTRSLNGRNLLDFDGSDSLETAVTLPADGTLAIHAVMVIDGVPNEYAALLALDGAVNDVQFDAAAASSFIGRLNITGAGTSVTLSGGALSGPVLVQILFDAAAGTAEVWVDGVLAASTGYSQPLDVAQTLKLMTNRSGNAEIDGAVGELILSTDPGARAAYHTYLATKWGLS